MTTSLSDLVDILSEINKKEWKGCMKEKTFNQNAILSGLKIID